MCGLRYSRVRRGSMGDDRQDTVLPLSNATVVLHAGDDKRRFRVNSAVLATFPNRRRVRLSFEGPRGSVTIEIPKTAFWQLTALFHERSISAGPKQPRTLGRRP
jgi:hypothetical protein